MSPPLGLSQSIALRAGKVAPLKFIDFTDAAVFPAVTSGGTMSAASFAVAAQGLALAHATEAAGVGMTIEAGAAAITFPSGSSLGTLIQGALARFGWRTVGGQGLLIEPSRTNLVQKNNVADPGSGGGPWTDAGFGHTAGAGDSAVAAPDGSTNATRTNIAASQYSAYQTFLAPNSPQNSQHVQSYWTRNTTGGTVWRGRFDYANLLPVKRVASDTTTWKRRCVICNQTIFPVTGGTCAAAGTVTLNEGGIAAEAVDLQWFLLQVELYTQAFSSAIITPAAATGTRNADLLSYPTTSDLMRGGKFSPEFVFCPSLHFPYQQSSLDGDLHLWKKDASNWGKILYPNTSGSGGFILASIGGVVEAIGPIRWSDQDIVDLRFLPMGNGSPLEAYYTRNGGTPIYLNKSPGAFGGNTMPSSGSIQILNDGTNCGFMGYLQALAFW